MGTVVAQRVDRARPRARRSLDERVLARFPALYRHGARFLDRLGPDSRRRQRLLRGQVLSGWAAASRRDFDLVLVRYTPDAVYEFTPGLVTLGLPARVEGGDAWMKALTDWAEVWAEWEFTLSFIVDLGPLVVTLGRFAARGAASDLDVQLEYAQVMETRDGLVRHEQDFNDWGEGLRAAGIDPGVLPHLEALGSATVLRLGDD